LAGKKTKRLGVKGYVWGGSEAFKIRAKSHSAKAFREGASQAHEAHEAFLCLCLRNVRERSMMESTGGPCRFTKLEWFSARKRKTGGERELLAREWRAVLLEAKHRGSRCFDIFSSTADGVVGRRVQIIFVVC